MEKYPPRIKKRAFTLTEILMVFLLMSISFSVLLFPSSAVWKKQKYEKSIVQLTNQLHLAKQIAYGYNTNVKVHLDKLSNQQFSICMEFDEEYQDTYKQYQKPLYLDGIDFIFEKGALKDNIVVEYISKWGPKDPTQIEICSSIKPAYKLTYAID